MEYYNVTGDAENFEDKILRISSSHGIVLEVISRELIRGWYGMNTSPAS
jgi:hypothetical protein